MGEHVPTACWPGSGRVIPCLVMLPAEEGVRNLHHDAGAVALITDGLAVGFAAGAEVFEDIGDPRRRCLVSRAVLEHRLDEADAVDIFVHTPEAQEGKAAFAEKRSPDFAKFR